MFSCPFFCFLNFHNIFALNTLYIPQTLKFFVHGVLPALYHPRKAVSETRAKISDYRKSSTSSMLKSKTTTHFLTQYASKRQISKVLKIKNIFNCCTGRLDGCRYTLAVRTARSNRKALQTMLFFRTARSNE